MLPFKQFFITENLRASAEKESAIIKDYQSGLSIKDIMGKHNIKNHKTIYDILSRNGLKKQNRTLDVPDEIRQQIIDLVRQRLTDQQIVDKLINSHPHMTSSMIRSIATDARKLDPSIPIRGEATPEQIEKIFQLASKMDKVNHIDCFAYSSGYIGKLVGLSSNTVNRIIKRIHPKLFDSRYNTPILDLRDMVKPARSSIGYVRKKTSGTRQQGFGDLGPKDPTYRTVMGRAQDVTGDQDYQVR